eukprot:m.46883 g.46883  ORF g.46883 m.46883 type:complete len:121 (-) comp12584_c0_seq1:186-548(-)
MALGNGSSMGVSLTLVAVLVAGLQVFSKTLAESDLGTFIAGAVSSLVFILLLTFMNNLENTIFKGGVAARLFPEVIIALLVTAAVAGSIHRISVTVSILFSFAHLYFLTRVSDSTYGKSS